MSISDDIAVLLRRTWHPVCTLAELGETKGGRGPLAVRLCGEDLVVADLGDGPVVLRDRCLHRSTKLSLGWIDGPALQCAYHGWRWDGEGRCVGVPSLPTAQPGAGLTARRIASYQVQVAYDLVWVRLETGWPTEVPPFPAWHSDDWRAVGGEPYTWPISVERRVENYTDLAHFAWVHDGSLGDRKHPEVPVPDIARRAAALHFHYDPPAVPDNEPTALVGASTYRVSLPGTVCIDFEVPGAGARGLWMTASPVDSEHCRTFWFTCRTDDLDGDDRPHLDFQRRVLDEDLPVIAGQHPPGIPWLGDDSEVSVGTDAVSIAYRSFMRAAAAADTPAALAVALAGQ
jgi:phenylpropionate dioxygenase-like ring-hydroxylating dioxygenase large terminal subunit